MEFGTLENILGILGMSPVGKMAGFILQELTKSRRTTHSKIELQDACSKQK
jgi:hypothetical protein